MRYILTVAILLLPLAAVAEEPHLTEALASQLRLVEQRPHDPQVLNDLGNLLQLAGELEESEAAYRQALGLSSEYLAARYNLALLLQRSDKPKAAARELRRVVKQDPGHARAHYQLGVTQAERGNRSRAVRHYARAFMLDPDLRLPRVNPHIIDNPLATRSILLAHQQRFSSADVAPRDYSDPARIAELLLPTATEAAEAEPAEPKANRRKRRPRPAPKQEAATEAAEEAPGEQALEEEAEPAPDEEEEEGEEIPVEEEEPPG